MSRDNRIHVRLAKLRAAGPREIQQPVHDLRRAESLLRDLVEQRRQPLIAAHLLGQHLRVRGDHRQRRVHFMRHARGQQPDRRQLLRLRQLRFHLRPVSNVVHQNDPAYRLEIARHQRRNRHIRDAVLLRRASPAGICRGCARPARPSRAGTPPPVRRENTAASG